MTDPRSTAADLPQVILLPSDRFVARRIPLVAGSPAAGQVELALENLSPFPVEQLYHGHVVSSAGDEALVYAAHRKRFSAEETAAWAQARVVLPAFIALQAEAPATPSIQLWRDTATLTAVAWDGRSPLPVALVARAADETDPQALVEELRARTGLAAAPLVQFSGKASGVPADGGKGFAFAIATASGVRPAVLGANAAGGADVREKGFLAQRHRTGRRDLVFWRIFSAALLGLAALVVLELGLFGGRMALRRLTAGVAARAGAVEKISTAQSLSQRIGDLSQRRLMPFEMLAAINRIRPASVFFQRVTTSGQRALEVEAQTANAADAGAYEAALRALPEIASVETRDLRARDGTTTFTLTMTFNAATPAPGGTP